jgi:hypothetical protein
MDYRNGGPDGVRGLTSGGALLSRLLVPSPPRPRRPFAPAAAGPFRSLLFPLFLCLTAGCSTRQTAAPPAPAYPAVPIAEVRVLDKLPSPPYDIVRTITVQVDAGINRDQTIADIRKRGGNAGANTVVLMSEKVFPHRIETTRQRIRLRRIIARTLRVPP